MSRLAALADRLAALLATLSLVLSSALSLHGQATPGPVRPYPVPVDTFTLSNGLRVAVSEDHSAPVVAVSLRYRVGSGHEEPGQRGFAHLFEHLLLPGTDALAPGESERLVPAAGGEQEAVTDPESVTFTYRLPAHRLDLALWLEAERMGSLRFSEAGLEAVRRLVVQERWLRLAQPYGAARQVLDTLPGGYGPYAHPPWTVEDLAGATVDDVEAFVRRHFVPANASLVVVGDVTPEVVRERVEARFGGIPGGRPAPLLPSPEPLVPAPGSRRVEVGGAGAPAPLVYVAWAVPPQGHPDAPALELVATLLGGEDGLLRRRLGGRAAVNAGAVLRMRRGPGLFVLAASPAGEGPAEAVEAALLELVATLREEGVDPEELERARARRAAVRLRSRLSTREKAAMLQHFWHVWGDPALINEEAELEEASDGDVSWVIQRYLVPDARIVVVTRTGAGGGGP